MRLSPQEVRVIKDVVRVFEPSARVLLFGSRVDDLKAGGDIDLLIEASSIDFSRKMKLLSKLKEHLGDQKIDVVIVHDIEGSIDPFVRLIAKEAVEL